MLDRARLKSEISRADRRKKGQAVALVAPLLAFLFLVFLLPLAGMLWRAVDDPELSFVMPRAGEALGRWDGKNLPDDGVYAALAADMIAAREAGNLAILAKRLNYDVAGYRSLLLNSARRLPPAVAAVEARATLIGIDERWGERAYWAALSRARGPLTGFYVLAAVDLRRDDGGAIVHTPDEEAIHRDVFARTLGIAATVTLLCLVMGFPVAYLLASLPARLSNPLMILVLLPFWTSLLVRTAAWVVLLQNAGIVNGALLALGLADKPVAMIYNRFGVVVAMTHVLLPYMILPLYSVMKTIPPSLMRAAASLGAPPWLAFARVYVPQCMPGIGAGALLVFILALGFYITPALVGGANDQMMSYFIAYHTANSANWGLASALGTALLLGTMLLYALYARLLGAERLRLG